jgi:hypothetical protein
VVGPVKNGVLDALFSGPGCDTRRLQHQDRAGPYSQEEQASGRCEVQLGHADEQPPNDALTDGDGEERAFLHVEAEQFLEWPK